MILLSLQIIWHYVVVAINLRFQRNNRETFIQHKYAPLDSELYEKMLTKTKSQMKSWFSTCLMLLGLYIFLSVGGLGYFEQWSFAVANYLNAGDLVEGIVFFWLVILIYFIVMLVEPIVDYFKDKEKSSQSSLQFIIFDNFRYMLWTYAGFALLVVLFGVILQYFGSSGFFVGLFTIIVVLILTNLLVRRGFLSQMDRRSLAEYNQEYQDVIESLCKKVGESIDNIFIISRKNKNLKNLDANAVFEGKNIILTSGIIQLLNPQEMGAVILHEIGHRKMKHLQKKMIFSLVSMGSFIGTSFLLINRFEVAKSFGFSATKEYMVLFLLFIFWVSVAGYFNALVNIMIRRFEYQADAYSWTHFPGAYLSDAIKKIQLQTDTYTFNHPSYVFSKCSHPTLPLRLEALDKLASSSSS